MLQTDWALYFLPAVELLLKGVDPYQSVYTVNPPWTFFLLAPVGLLPHSLGLVVGAVLPVAALVYASWKVRKPYLIALVGLSFPFIDLCAYGNLDWMVLLGVLSTNPLSPFLLTVKPQAGALALVGQLGQLRGKGWKAYARVFVPFLVISGLLLALYPGFFRYVTTFNVRLAEVSTFSLFPYLLPLVPPLLWLAYRRADPLYGVLASLCVSPYLMFWSVVPAMFLIAERNWKWGLLVNLLTWVVVALVLLKVIAYQF